MNKVLDDILIKEVTQSIVGIFNIGYEKNPASVQENMDKENVDIQEDV